MKQYTLLFGLLCTLWLFAPVASFAQSEEWVEQNTQYFAVLYQAGNEAEANAYASFVDDIYNDIADVFNHRAEPPLTLRLYPTFESYYRVNPTAREMTGVVAHADFRRRELAVVLPQTELQTPDEIQNNIRHELTHIVASELSNNRLNTGFQEGIAQYNELPTAELDRKMTLLERAYTQNNLLTWSSFEDRDIIYGNPEKSYPQTLSVVTFLIDTYGFEDFRVFIATVGETSGYRSALEQVYNASPRELEARWQEWLPTFLDGSYVANPAASYDLAYPRQLIGMGRYADAEAELQQSIEWLQTTPQQDLLEEAERLLGISRDGQQAEQLAAEARAALVDSDYARAQSLVAQARTAYAALGDTRQERVLRVYAARAERGLSADAYMERANQLATTFRIPEARLAAEAAAAEFAALGDAPRMNAALELRQSMNEYQRLAGLGLLALGTLGIFISLAGRWHAREPEVW